MFVIHRDQVDAFAALRREAFERFAAGYVGELIGRDVPIEAARASVSRALSRRIETEPEVLQWLALEQVAGGPLTERWPWAEQFLSDDRSNPTGKLRTLVRAAAERGHAVADVDLLGAWLP